MHKNIHKLKDIFVLSLELDITFNVSNLCGLYRFGFDVGHIQPIVFVQPYTPYTLQPIVFGQPYTPYFTTYCLCSAIHPIPYNIYSLVQAYTPYTWWPRVFGSAIHPPPHTLQSIYSLWFSHTIPIAYNLQSLFSHTSPYLTT